MANSDVKVKQELEVDFTFTLDERNQVVGLLDRVGANPYSEYPNFKAEIRTLMRPGDVPTRFTKFCEAFVSRDHRQLPFVFVKNCPIDENLPILDYDEPVLSKRTQKRTFISEGFLELYAQLVGTEPIGYINVNDGDVFQDIAPKRSLATSQSQKAIERIYFHKDLANHFVRPDFVNILGLRNFEGNEVWTSFVRNLDVYSELNSQEISILSQPLFSTPYDDLTVMTGAVKLGEAPDHPIISGDLDFRYFENRTTGKTKEASEMVERFKGLLHKHKKYVHILPGDLLGEHNNYSIHSKEIGRVTDQEKLKERWLMKTVNVFSLASHERHYLPDRYGIVNG